MKYIYLDLENDKIHLIAKEELKGISSKFELLKLDDSFVLEKEVLIFDEKVNILLTATELKDKLTYRENRLNAYPPINEQLDMIYHDSKEGTTTFVDSINEVKERFKKDGTT